MYIEILIFSAIILFLFAYSGRINTSKFIQDNTVYLKKLKEDHNFNTPVLALTADALETSKDKYLNEGFIDYISKPFNKEQIKEKLDKIFQMSEYTDIPKELLDMSKSLTDINMDGSIN